MNKSNDIWAVSDQHFSHRNILKFTNFAGQKVRPEFNDVEEMNEVLIQLHNSEVKQNDLVIFMGDIGFNRTDLEKILPRLNGKKKLLLGNHDNFKMEFYSKYFSDISVVWKPIRGLIFSHYPLYIGESDTIRFNVHGHIHRGQIADPRYYNVSVEETDYKPIHFDEILKVAQARGIGFFQESDTES